MYGEVELIPDIASVYLAHVVNVGSQLNIRKIRFASIVQYGISLQQKIVDLISSKY
jgi:hypothetical protein